MRNEFMAIYDWHKCFQLHLPLLYLHIKRVDILRVCSAVSYFYHMWEGLPVGHAEKAGFTRFMNDLYVKRFCKERGTWSVLLDQGF